MGKIHVYQFNKDSEEYKDSMSHLGLMSDVVGKGPLLSRDMDRGMALLLAAASGLLFDMTIRLEVEGTLSSGSLGRLGEMVLLYKFASSAPNDHPLYTAIALSYCLLKNLIRENKDVEELLAEVSAVWSEKLGEDLSGVGIMGAVPWGEA